MRLTLVCVQREHKYHSSLCMYRFILTLKKLIETKASSDNFRAPLLSLDNFSEVAVVHKLDTHLPLPLLMRFNGQNGWRLRECFFAHLNEVILLINVFN